MFLYGVGGRALHMRALPTIVLEYLQKINNF